MIQLRRHTTIPTGIMDMRVHAPASAALIPWYLAGGAPTPIAVYQPKGAASLAASYVNLVNPGTYDAAPGVAPTHASATGWSFTGAQYLKTGVVPASGWSMLLRYSDAATGLGWGMLCGMSGTGGGNRFFVLGESLSKNFFGAGNYVEGSTFAASGVVGIAGQQGYLNAAPDGAATGAWSTPNNGVQIIVGRANVAEEYTWQFPSGYKSQAFAIYNTTLTAAQVAAVSAAMAAL